MATVDIDAIAERLRAENIYVVHQQTGISYNALDRIRNGGDARVSTLIRITRYFDAVDGGVGQ